MSLGVAEIRRRRLGVIIALLILVVVVAATITVVARSSGSPGASVPPFPPDTQTRETLKSLTLRIAASNHGAQPADVRVYAASRSVATELLDGSKADSDQPVYVILAHGQFAADSAPRPPGAPAPIGREMHIVWDPASNAVTDFGLGDDEPNVEQLGAGIPLDLGGR